jgi:hypothetical protein
MATGVAMMVMFRRTLFVMSGITWGVVLVMKVPGMILVGHRGVNQARIARENAELQAEKDGRHQHP